MTMIVSQHSMTGVAAMERMRETRHSIGLSLFPLHCFHWDCYPTGLTLVSSPNIEKARP